MIAEQDLSINDDLEIFRSGRKIGKAYAKAFKDTSEVSGCAVVGWNYDQPIDLETTVYITQLLGCVHLSPCLSIFNIFDLVTAFYAELYGSDTEF